MSNAGQVLDALNSGGKSSLAPAALPLGLKATPPPDVAAQIAAGNGGLGGGSAPSAQLGGRSSQMDAMLARTENRLSAIDKASGALQPPQMETLPPPPTPKNTNPIEIWGSAAMTMAAIGSLLTRQPLTTALNSAAAVMNAYKKNDMDTANAEFERWKSASELAIKQNNFQLEAYKTALQKAQTDEKLATAEFTTYAHAFGDETAAQVAETRGMQGAEKLVMDREALNNKLTANMPKVIEAKQFMDSYQELTKSPQYLKANAQDRAQMVAQLMPGDSLPKNVIDFYGAQLNMTGKMPSLGMKAGGVRNQILVSAAMQAFAGGQSAGDIVAEQASVAGQKHALQQIDKTKANVVNFEATAKKEADLALSLMDKGAGPTGTPVIDQWLRAGGAATGNPDVTAFNTAITSFKNEYAKIMSGATGAQGSTDAARREADELINPNMSAAQIRKDIEVMKKGMDNRTSSLSEMQKALQDSISGGGPAQAAVGQIVTGKDGQQYRITGGDPSDPDVELVSPSADPADSDTFDPTGGDSAAGAGDDQ